MTAREALARAAARIGGPTPRLDAELLLAHLLGLSREALLLSGLARPVDRSAYDALVDRRAAGEPVAYITGHRAFWSLDLLVTPHVLIPRPESETLIEAALRLFPPEAAPRILDLGTGSGCLLLAALSCWPRGWGLGVDRSPEALAVARTNARETGLAPRAAFVLGDWAAAVAPGWDLILANPPYVGEHEPLPAGVARYEPQAALRAGADGLAAYRRFLPDLPRLLAPGGTALLEIGSTQGDMVSATGEAAGLAASILPDLSALPRCVVLKKRRVSRE